MTVQTLIRAALIAGAALVPLAAAAHDTQYGATMPLGDGTVRAFSKTDCTGQVTRIGIEMTEEAVASLGHEMAFVSVPLPEAAIAAGYDHVSLDWMPHGHEPAGLFDTPHFDVHFYMIPEAERLAIQPSDPRFAEKSANRPSVDLMPANFVPPPVVEVIPAMGEHWLDSTDPVLAGAPFEAVLIYGGWDGDMVFVEPMVTRDLLQSRRDFGGAVGQPARVERDVMLPNAWSVSFDAGTGTHVVSIDDLVRRVPGDALPSATN